MFTDFFGQEIKVGDWVMKGNKESGELFILRVSEVTPKKVLLENEKGIHYCGVVRTSKYLCIIPEDKIVLYRLER